ncbi:hypothetical protein Patl1_24233 [Pistacia atlantica]|uniref:Uncharacterized protein n=1 Tax=Pistacia atlantica TaxID=434234 RepID=A0ACC1A3J3_9ROSI|nr:hypothetical protein Patl1_24233 [Pistacia atlantica]
MFVIMSSSATSYNYFAFMVNQEWLQSNYRTNPSVLRDADCIIQLSSSHICVCDNQMSDRFQGCIGALICNTKSGYSCSAKCPSAYIS